MRTTSDFWVCGRKEEDRLLYLILPKAERTLSDVDSKSNPIVSTSIVSPPDSLKDEFQKLSAIAFKNVFISTE
jgi:hypothetical protein